jgi:WD40 repeat protein
VATHTLVGHTGSIASVTVTGDGRHAVSRSYDGTLKVWDLERGCLLATFTSDGPLNCHAVAPDGVRLVAGDQFGRVHFLSLEGVPPE